MGETALLRRLILQDKESTEDRGDENNGAHNERSDGELAGAKSGRGTRAGRRGTGAAGSASGGDSAVTGTSQVGLLGTSRLGAIALEARAVTSTVLEVVAGTAGEGGELVSGNSNVPGGGLVRAGGSRAAGLVTTVAGGVSGVGVGVLEGGEVVKLLDAGAVDLDKTVLGVLLRVLVDETTRVDGRHVGAVDGLDLVELTLVGVATELGQAVQVSKCITMTPRIRLQDGDAVVVKLLDLLVPTGTSEGVWVTPGVVVESVEVAANRVLAAVLVVGHLITVGLDIGRAITDGDLAELASVDVRLDVTSDGLDERSAVGGSIVVDDLVTREEEQSVGVGSELLDGCENALEVNLVVGDLGRSTVQGVLGGVDIKGEVDTSIGERVHAGVVGRSVVDSVDTDSVDTELLELGDVTLAASLVGNGVLCIRCAT